MNSTHYTAYVSVKGVPACGYKVITLEPDKNCGDSGIAKKNTLENEYLAVAFNNNGTVNITDKISGREYKNVNYLSSQGEVGNAWKHQSPENDEIFTSLSSRADIKCVENGGLSASFEVSYTFGVPKDCADKRSKEKIFIPVNVIYTLQKGAKSLNIRVKLNNTAKDHWLRANFPTGIKSDYSYSDSHFDIVKRDAKIPDSTGWVEPAYGMQPLRTFACVEDEDGGFAVMPEGLYEYEVFDDARMALTLIRGCRIKQQVSEEKITVLDDTGILCLGEREFEYNLYFYHSDRAELPNEAAKLYAKPQIALFGKSYGELPREMSLVSVDNKKIHITAVKPAENGAGVIVRLFNPTDKAQPVTLDFGIKYKNLYSCGMDETVKEKISNKFEVAHKKIITVYVEV